jgi:hypothetical protein
MKDDDRKYEGIGFRGLSNYQAPTDADIQRGIDAAMRQTVRHDTRNVHDRGGSLAAAPDSDRVRGTAGAENGWVEPAPLGLPSGIELIDRLCDQLLPHAPGYGKSKDEGK